MTSGWTRVTLGEIATIERRSVQPEAIEPGATYVGLEHIHRDGSFVGLSAPKTGELASTKFSFTDRHILYGKLRPYLSKIACPDFSGICSTDILPILPGPRVQRRFLLHFLRQPSVVEDANSRTVGVNLPRLSPSVLEGFVVPLPPLAEQQRIVEILDRAEALRVKRRMVLARFDPLVRALFFGLFGDLGDNPQDWPRKPLAELVRGGDTIRYGVVQPGDEFEGGVPLVRVGDLAEGRVAQGDLKRIDPAIEGKYKRSRLRGDEILVSCVGSVGMIALADESVKGFNIARAVARVPLSDSVSRTFLATYLQSDRVQHYFTRELRAVSQPTLNLKQLSETAIVLPPIELQREFGLRLAAVEKLKAAHRESLAQLNALFASLQHQAFRGGL